MAAQYDSSVTADGRSLEFKEVKPCHGGMAHADAHGFGSQTASMSSYPWHSLCNALVAYLLKSQYQQSFCSMSKVAA